MIEKNKIVGDMILKFNEIEFYLKQIIIKYLKPNKNKEKFYSQILFNNSIISFNSKLKLFKNINSDEKWLEKKELREFIDNIHYLNNIRNSLVHTENAIEIEKDQDGEIKNIHPIIDFFKPNGEFDVLKLNDVYYKFCEKHELIKKRLLKLHKNV